MDGIRTVVELTDQNQCVVIGMSYRIETRQLDYIKHRSAVIKLVLDLKQQLCPHIHTCEYLINQSSLKQWPAEEIHLTDDDVQLFSIEKVSESMLNHYHQGLIEPRSGERACNYQYPNVDGEMPSVTINRYPYNHVYFT